MEKGFTPVSLTRSHEERSFSQDFFLPCSMWRINHLMLSSVCLLLPFVTPAPQDKTVFPIEQRLTTVVIVQFTVLNIFN